METFASVRQAIDEGRHADAMGMLVHKNSDHGLAFSARAAPAWVTDEPAAYAPILMLFLSQGATHFPEYVRCGFIRGIAPLLGIVAEYRTLLPLLRGAMLKIAEAQDVSSVTATALRDAIATPVAVGPMHPALLLSSLRANNPSIASKFLHTHTALLVDERIGGIEDYLLFHYYSAMVHAAYKQWDEAILSLRSVQAVDAHSAVVVAASKMLTALELMTTGAVATPMATAWRISPQDLTVAWHHETYSFLDDAHRGLAPQMRKAHGFLDLQRHSQIYKCIPLGRLATKCGLTEEGTVDKILEAVEAGYVRATITRDNVVQFSDMQDSPDPLSTVQDQLGKWTGLSLALHRADTYVRRSHAYLGVAFVPTAACAALIDEQRQHAAGTGIVGTLRHCLR